MAGNIIKVTMFWTKYADDSKSKQSVHEWYVTRMKELLKKYDLKMENKPKQRGADFTIDYKGEFKEYPKYEAKQIACKLRYMAHKLQDGEDDPRSGCVAIFCPYAPVQLSYDTVPSNTAGMTFGYDENYENRVPTDGVDWLPFVVINSRHASPDRGTLLHEVCHAAGIPHYEGKDKKNIMTYGTDRSTLDEAQRTKLKAAYFAHK